MTEYGKTLRALVDLSGVKLSAIARDVGYDLSYVSKWCNKDKLPAAKTAPEINHLIGKSIGKEIATLGLIDEFYEIYSAYSPKANSDLALSQSTSNRDDIDAVKRDVTKLLNITYELSRKSAEKRHNGSFSKTEVIIRTSEILDFFSRRLPEALIEIDEPLDVLCSLDILKFLSGSRADYGLRRIHSNEIHVRIGLDFDLFKQNPKHYLKELYFFINAKSHISFDFYDDSLIKNLNAIVIKDYYAIMCSQDNNGNIVLVSVITDPDEVNQIYERMLPSFRTTDLLMHHAEPEHMLSYGYRTGFYALTGYQILQPHGFEFLLPEECWPNISKAAKKLDASLRSSGILAKVTEQLHITWQETFEKGKIEFFVLKSSLMKYMEDGEIIFADVVYHMTPEERKLHIQNTLKIAKKNHDIKFYVINDDDLPGITHLFRTGVYSNGKKMFLKCSDRYHMDHGPWFYSIISDAIILETGELLDEIKESPYCYEFSGDNLDAFMDKYGSMVYRIIDLG